MSATVLPPRTMSVRYLPSNCSSSLRSSIAWNPETNISGWRMDLLQGTARKQDGKVDKGRKSFLLGWKKESYLPLVIARGTVERRGVADDDHRSSYSTIVDGSSMDGKRRTHERSRHCAISNANVKSDLILDKFNNSLPSCCRIHRALSDSRKF